MGIRVVARLHATWLTLAQRDAGATMPEYAMVVAVIALVSLLTMFAIGGNLDLRFQDVDSKVRP